MNRLMARKLLGQINLCKTRGTSAFKFENSYMAIISIRVSFIWVYYQEDDLPTIALPLVAEEAVAPHS